MYLRMSGAPSNVAGTPSASSYLVFGPPKPTSSMYTQTLEGISGLRMKVTSSWKMGTELVHPIGRVTNLSAPKGVWNVVKSLDSG